MKPVSVAAAIALTTCLASPLSADPMSFPTPQDALDAFAGALTTPGRAALLGVFGDDAAETLSTGDPVEDRLHRIELIALMAEGYRMTTDAEGQVTLLLGAEGWPFPIPLSRGTEGWAFDLEAGRAEIAAREIGHNELDVITLLEAYVDVQSAFRLTDHDGDGVMEFAGSIISSDAARDGLYWPGAGSPLGQRFARATLFGYNDGIEDHPAEPLTGYYFRLLDGQGPSAPGGEMSYRIGENMVAGHAMLAVPAIYGETGVHSFLVAENGIVLEADLGPDTLTSAEAITRYDPGSDWTPVY
ncbi:DUF2950 family protein [Dinoroseobacter sp. S124A]|uniref:DUF2950 family protein n=1 Tax=Dinoroseobacter sp. S124A TaxID=3415128 RepID=UPI003C7A3B44